ncbi:MAG TPA: DUF1698 domain-containing protein, partial [Spongiibacteraceae bacterium]
MIDFAPFLTQMQNAGLQKWSQQLHAELPQLMHSDRHGDLAGWYAALAALPQWPIQSVELDRNSVRIISAEKPGAEQCEQLQTILMQLHPWRKGPFDICGIHIDTEWRSDWKWDRLKQTIAPLAGRRVLD